MQYSCEDSTGKMPVEIGLAVHVGRTEEELSCSRDAVWIGERNARQIGSGCWWENREWHLKRNWLCGTSDDDILCGEHKSSLSKHVALCTALPCYTGIHVVLKIKREKKFDIATSRWQYRQVAIKLYLMILRINMKDTF